MGPVPPRPLGGSHTIQHADARTRALADAMVQLNAEGGCTDEALLREGFSAAELRHHGDAARALADGLFVRMDRTAEEPEPIAARMARVIVAKVGLEASAITALQRAGFSGAEIGSYLDDANRIAERTLRRKLRFADGTEAKALFEAPASSHLTALAYAIGRLIVANQAAGGMQ